MKKILSFTLALTALLASCNKVLEIKIIYSLSVNPTTISFAANETTTKTVAVTTDANSWDATSEETWIAIEKQGSTLRLTPTANTQTTERTATVTVTAATAPAVTVTITQAGANTLTVSTDLIAFEANETGTKTVTVTTNAATWDATTTAEWLTIEKQGNTLMVTTTENTVTSGRSAIVTITAGTATPVAIAVTQGEAIVLSINPVSFAFAANEITTQTATITTNAASWDAFTEETWLTIEKQGTTLQLTPSANTSTLERSANITVTAGTADPVIVTVSQAAANTLSVNSATISFGANETATKTITVTTNASSWDYIGDVEWLTIVQQNNTIRLFPNSLNTGTSQRSATINITAGTANPVAVTVTQPVTTMSTMTMATEKNQVTIELSGIGTAIIFWGDDTASESKSLSSSTSTVFTHNYSNSTSRTIMIAGSSIWLLNTNYGNELTSIDISKNKELRQLDCQGNRLTYLDVSNNTGLTNLNCGTNQLITLDMSRNTVLKTFHCPHNELINLDLSKNAALTDLACEGNQLTSLDVSNNTLLERLECSSNQLSSLDVSKNTALSYVRIPHNYLNAGALNSLFSTLHNYAAGTREIYISHNGPQWDGTGTAGCNQSIATDKGWTVYPPLVQISWEIGYPTASNVTATYDNGTLSISGKGEMQDNGPWKYFVGPDITKVVINSGVTNIGSWAFWNGGWRCENITSVTIPNTVSSIGYAAFDECHYLSSIDIPNNVTSIEDFAFAGCTGLTDVTVNWVTPLSIPSNTFSRISLANVRLHIPEGTYDLYAAAPVWKDFNIVKP